MTIGAGMIFWLSKIAAELAVFFAVLAAIVIVFGFVLFVSAIVEELSARNRRGRS